MAEQTKGNQGQALHPLKAGVLTQHSPRTPFVYIKPAYKNSLETSSIKKQLAFWPPFYWEQKYYRLIYKAKNITNIKDP